MAMDPLTTLAPLAIAVCGADLAAQVDGKPLPLWASLTVDRGSRISFKGRVAGCRAYLAVRGGLGRYGAGAGGAGAAATVSASGSASPLVKSCKAAFASGSPWAAARRYQATASSRFLGTPSPIS